MRSQLGFFLSPDAPSGSAEPVAPSPVPAAEPVASPAPQAPAVHSSGSDDDDGGASITVEVDLPDYDEVVRVMEEAQAKGQKTELVNGDLYIDGAKHTFKAGTPAETKPAPAQAAPAEPQAAPPASTSTTIPAPPETWKDFAAIKPDDAPETVRAWVQQVHAAAAAHIATSTADAERARTEYAASKDSFDAMVKELTDKGAAGLARDAEFVRGLVDRQQEIVREYSTAVWDLFGMKNPDFPSLPPVVRQQFEAALTSGDYERLPGTQNMSTVDKLGALLRFLKIQHGVTSPTVQPSAASAAQPGTTQAPPAHAAPDPTQTARQQAAVNTAGSGRRTTGAATPPARSIAEILDEHDGLLS